MSTTCNTLGVPCPSCLDHRRLEAASADFWKTIEGINRRIDSLAQDFSFKTVNNATKIIGKTNKAKWMKWDAVEDAKLCDRCKKYSKGGRNGYYRITWFLPKMPVHPNCRCTWIIYFYDPFK